MHGVQEFREYGKHGFRDPDPLDLVGAAALVSAIVVFIVLVLGVVESPASSLLSGRLGALEALVLAVLSFLVLVLVFYLRSSFPNIFLYFLYRLVGKSSGEALAGEDGASELEVSAVSGQEDSSDNAKGSGQPGAGPSQGLVPVEASSQPAQDLGPGSSPPPAPEKGAGESSPSVLQDLEILSKIPSRIERLEAEIASLKDEMKQIKEGVEQSLVDVRTLLSEISNPFNYMRRFLEERELQDLAPPVVEKNGESDPGPDAVEGGAGSHGEAGSPPPVAVEERGAVASLVLSAPSVSGLMRLVIFVGESLPALGREGLARLVDLGVSAGGLPQWVRPVVAGVVDLVEETGLPPKRLALMIYRLAKSMGVVDKEAEYLAMILSDEGGRGG